MILEIKYPDRLEETKFGITRLEHDSKTGEFTIRDRWGRDLTLPLGAEILAVKGGTND